LVRLYTWWSCFLIVDRRFHVIIASFTNIFFRVSVHSNGSSHATHHHFGSAVSGVLYLAVPKGSGSVYFEDPRGSLPPFGKILRVQPDVGDLILFPGWLTHGVSATMTSQARVSISFNLMGSTLDQITSDVNHAYMIEAS
jgi:Putative 2OG-Fe(II) oxygenase